MNFKTEQEKFWAGEFGTSYIQRNNSPKLLAANIALFARALRCSRGIRSCIEFGANIGLNLAALRVLDVAADLHAIEINAAAAKQLATVIPPENVIHSSILDFSASRTWDLVLIKGVLIHIDPQQLPHVYRTLYEASSRYLLICEYYNPTPVSVAYRGHQDRLFKRDFAGELLDAFPDLRLVDYGFCYRRDPNFPQDDATWFLLEKSTGHDNGP